MHDQHLCSDSFYKTLFFVGPILFFISEIFMLRGTHNRIGNYPDEEYKWRIYTKKEVFFYNYFYWTFSFFLGL